MIQSGEPFVVRIWVVWAILLSKLKDRVAITGSGFEVDSQWRISARV
jgi:hypothetical protein